jgi:nicotinamidase-related amidase
MQSENKPALIVIDVQNDYFPGGSFPLWNTEATLVSVEKAIRTAKGKGIPVIYIQHVSNSPGPLLNKETEGVKIHPSVLAAGPDVPVVVKEFADSFEKTTLHATLQSLCVNELILAGMMTQNCVTHTALSRRADDYRRVTVLTDATTTVSEILHMIAIGGMSTRVGLATIEQALA